MEMLSSKTTFDGNQSQMEDEISIFHSHLAEKAISIRKVSFKKLNLTPSLKKNEWEVSACVKLFIRGFVFLSSFLFQLTIPFSLTSSCYKSRGMEIENGDVIGINRD